VFLICLFKDAELYCVSTNILLILELMQLEIGISTNRYLPAIGTAGLLLLRVNGYKRVPAPPPRITAITDLLIHIFACIIFFVYQFKKFIEPRRKYFSNKLKIFL